MFLTINDQLLIPDNRNSFFFQRKYSNDLKNTGKKTYIPLNLGSFLAIIVLIKI